MSPENKAAKKPFARLEILENQQEIDRVSYRYSIAQGIQEVSTDKPPLKITAHLLPRNIRFARFCVVCVGFWGPASGKGTQCERLVRDYNFEHISVGEVLREYIAKGGEDSARLNAYIEKGELIPDLIIVELLEKVIRDKKKQKYLIDGFPRNVEQAKLLEQKIKEIDMIINIHCEQEVLVSRLLERAKTSGRVDDNEETMKNRIKVYYEKTVPVSEYYKKFGKIKQIDGNQTIDEVYAQVKKAIKPNLIFFMGPPATGKTSVAKILSQKLKYLFVDIEEFYKQYKCKTQEDLSNALMHYCSSVPHNCIIFDGFFHSSKQAKVFFDHFADPQFVFYLDTPQDEVYMNISKYYPTEKQKKYQQQQYLNYIAERKDLLDLMNQQNYFKPINAATSIENIVSQVFEISRPTTLVSFDHHNQDLAAEYYQIMEEQRGYICCDMEELQESEAERGTQLGKKIDSFLQAGKAPSSIFKVELIQKIMFNEPDNTKFVFSNWPQNFKDFQLFEKEFYPIDYLLNFQNPSQEYSFKHQEDAFLHYFSQGKVINIDKKAIDILDSYTTKRAKYGFVTGPQAGGKSTIAKYIADKFKFELVETTGEKWEALQELIKAKFIKEDDENQDVTYDHFEKYFQERLNPALKNKVLIFDSFPYEQQQQEQFIKAVGLPSFIVNLNVNKDKLINRYKEKNEMDKEAELGEEEQAKIEEILQKYEQQTEFWTDLSRKNYGVKLFNLNADLSLKSTQRYTHALFNKRVFIVVDYLNYKLPKGEEFNGRTYEEIKSDQRLIFLNLCAKRGVTFVDIEQLIQKHAENNQNIKNQYDMRWTKTPLNYPSNYSPELIQELIQEHLAQFPVENRDILLYNYPSADIPVEKSQQEGFFPRAGDELRLIEENLGPVRMVTVLTREKVQHQIQDEIWELEKPPEKPKKQVGEDGEEEPEQEPEEEEEEEEGKPKFNIFDFTWTKSNGIPKTLTQWYNKTRKTIKKHYSLQTGTERSFDQLNNYFDLINEENEQNKEEEDFRKVNLFIQLRYDQVDQEEEPEPEEPESEEEQEQQNSEEEEGEKAQNEGENQEGENQQEGENNEGEEEQEEEN
ncbi:P-loop containing nucleoside triphosphate hydrolase [Pseudocohnilembus persalinus]|uniref:p-loop containing nucleoside triphosphate hydrolase n=1 Tax=Pseudocohnilembus persalinus TaxID=266149 RepID=A0A0V0QF23_PSEPJ|nr:P-loop containing nucleoside triphosphate hydrolase [Pseudocohnilembus persalinus]|eukprot:KRX00815.1 P-loop containing nucleoside triphosphate hydrolase [Pseudocohnilembus persalinus]